MVTSPNVRQHLLFYFRVPLQASGSNELSPILLGLAVDMADAALTWVCGTPDEPTACFYGLHHATNNVLRFAWLDVFCHF